MNLNFPIIDSHIHMYTDRCIDYFLNYRVKYGFDAINVACLANLNKKMEYDATQNILAAIIKLEDEHFYAHGGLVYPEFPVSSPLPPEFDFEAQARELIAMGFDGIKMLEAKPTTRKLTSLPVNSPLYDGFYAYLEKEQIPVVSHVADPETFWDPDKAPEFSFKEGWFYGDGTFLTKEEIYDEVNQVLKKYPDLCITFPHFYFLSNYPEQAGELLDRYTNVKLDITPGREMYDNFSQNREVIKNFFIKYADRIIFGTDMTSDNFQGSPSDMLDAIKRFLATEGEFEYWGFNIHGIGLPLDIVTKICHDNFLKYVGKKPKAIDKSMLKAYIKRFLPYIKDQGTKTYITDYYNQKL